MIRVFPRRTKWTPSDDLAFVGDPPLFRPIDQPVKVSICFTWDIPEGERLYKAWNIYYRDVELGGPAFGNPGGEFNPGQFIKRGVTITSRGCPNKCAWCEVPRREGNIRHLRINPGWIIQDNNLFACNRSHIEMVFEMLTHQKRSVIFSGGIDARLLTQHWHRNLLENIKVKELWFACDMDEGIPWLERVRDFLNYPQNKMRCYVMIGFGGEPIFNAERRLEKVYELGFDPFCQLYRGEDEREYTQEWKDLARKWSRPAFYKTAMAIAIRGLR